MKQRIIPICIILLCVYWIYMGIFQYGFWVDNGPGGGFMPVFSSVLAAAFAVGLLWKPHRDQVVMAFRALSPVIMVVLAVMLSYIVGLLAALTIMVLVWLWKVEKFTLLKTLLFTAILMGSVWAVFRLWLQVPLPMGMFA